jgi:hypothetical protein
MFNIFRTNNESNNETTILKLQNNFESKPQQNETYYDENTDYESTDYESTEEEFIESFYLKHQIYKSQYFSIYRVDGRDFINNISMWACQRQLNQQHVDNLELSIIKRNYLLGTFKVIRNNLKQIRCIDGQHRIKALQQIMDKNAKYNCEIIVEVYDVESFEDQKANGLFIDVNNTLNVTGDMAVNYIVQNIIKKLLEKWVDIIIDIPEGKRCNRPRINKREDIIIKNIIELNNNMGRWSREMLITKCGKINNSLYEKAKKSGCYLGLIKNCNWIDIVEETL